MTNKETSRPGKTALPDDDYILRSLLQKIKKVYFNVYFCKTMTNLFIFICVIPIQFTYELLQVQKNEIRQAESLDGLWTFVREPFNSNSIGLNNNWNEIDLNTFTNSTSMPVPSAYNDIGIDDDLRDHVGWVWYQYYHILQTKDQDYRHFIRFSSVNYYCIVFINGVKVKTNYGAHLPFEAEIGEYLEYGKPNKITVAVNNTLTEWTLPSAQFHYEHKMNRKLDDGRLISRLPPNAVSIETHFDFFNYAGILRSVYLVKLSKCFISDIIINAQFNGSMKYQTFVQNSNDCTKPRMHIEIFSSNGTMIHEENYFNGSMHLKGIDQWWPIGQGKPVLYTFVAKLIESCVDNKTRIVDVYRENFGFRSVRVTQSQIYLNEKPFYCRGFGMHEDFPIHGRGYNQVAMIKDLNLLEWTGANCYRTSHYPYSEERMYENDRRGMVVIVEAPAVGLRNFNKKVRNLHLRMLEDMIQRDRNHPSVIAWSLANEPKTNKKDSRSYFQFLIEKARQQDPTRLITTVYGKSNFDNDQTADLMDFICVNKYYGWYVNHGHLSWINQSVYWEVALWSDIYKKPVIVSEYGADSVSGLSQEPAFSFSEQYQNNVLEETHKAFDVLKKENLLAGEMVWNFADFQTDKALTRVGGNLKGIFTRDRQPKMAAYTIRKRYLNLSKLSL